MSKTRTPHQIFKPGIKMRNGQFIIPMNGRTKELVTELSEIEALTQEGVLLEEMVATTDSKHFFTTAINDYFMQEPSEIDRKWEQFFRIIPMSSGSGMLFPFRDRNTVADEGSHGIVFKDVGELGEVKFGTVTSDEKYISVVKRGAALGYSREWFEDGMFGMIEMATEDFRNAYWDKLARIHYGIITAAVDSGVSKSTAVGGSTLDDLIAAINATYVVMQRNRFRPSIILTPPEHLDFVEKTMHDVHRDNKLTSAARRMSIVDSEYVDAGKIYLVHPQSRLVSLDRQGLKLENFTDLMHDAEGLVGFFRRGAALGDGKCIRAITGL